MYSLSTCWNSHRHTDGRAMLHGIRISLLPGIIEAVEAGEMKISSLHNFCPLPLGVNHAAPNLFLFSSEDRRERENAWRHSLKTIETAARLHAQAVVLHLGRVEMKEYTERLLEMLHRGLKDSPKYAALREEALEKREKKKERYMELTCEFLGRLAVVAGQNGVKLGIENRQALEEIPPDSDLELLLLQFNRPEIGYWHDCGHAQIKENLGVLNHRQHLESLAPRLLGLHVHDVQYPGRDHRAPGSGIIDFAALKPMLKPEHIKVFELSPSLAPEDVAAGVVFVKECWGEG
jgi:sugar phosphate isomerase/epimerase